MPKGRWIQTPVTVAYARAFLFFRPRKCNEAVRWAFVSQGLLLLMFLALQVAAVIYLEFNPIKINLRF